jgi:hypothetical protein
MLDFLPAEEVHRPENWSILPKNRDDKRVGMADATIPVCKECRDSVEKGVNVLMGGWSIWLILGGLFLFLMFRSGGCRGGHGGHDGHSGGSGEAGRIGSPPTEDHEENRRQSEVRLNK